MFPFNDDLLAPSTPTHSSAPSVSDDSPAPQPPSKTKRSFILGISYLRGVEWFHTSILCVVDPVVPVATDVANLENFILQVVVPAYYHYKRVQHFSLEEDPSNLQPNSHGYIIFQATLEQLVEHLRAGDMEPSLNPVRPNLWGTGKSTLVIP